MLKNYVKVALRYLRANKTHSIINIAGLSVGMTVALLIGLWIWDEVSFDKTNQHYNRIAQVRQTNTQNGEKTTWPVLPIPMAPELRKSYGASFSKVTMASWNELHVVGTPDKSISTAGTFLEEQGPALLDVYMLSGKIDALRDPDAVILSNSLSTALFGDTNPIGKALKLDGTTPMKVAGVYADLPVNSTFGDVQYMGSWKILLAINPWIQQMNNPWGNNSYRVFVELADNADMAATSLKIKDSKLRNVRPDERKNNPEIWLYPMSQWHLYNDFKNGAVAGGRITFVWLFGIIGGIVLLLACINFMNLSTARSERRAKEVGIRKAIGSLRSQLIGQFYSESLVVAFFAFLIAIGLAQLTLPFFNQVADKKMTIPWTSPVFWATGIGFSIFTGIIAGSYPALYLSSFNPVKVLKGTFKAGRFAAIPRKVLVVVQFTVSVILAIGTVVVFRQIQYAKDRPTGYDRGNLISISVLNTEVRPHFEAIRTDLLRKNAITEMSGSWSPLTGNWSSSGGLDWEGKDPNLSVDFPNSSVSNGYGKTVGWQFVGGRDFSRDFPTDSDNAFIINEAAAEFMHLQHPVGATIRWDSKPYTVVGVVRNMIVESPYTPIKPTLYYLVPTTCHFMEFRLNPNLSTKDALTKIEATLKTYSPNQPFNYKFANEEYAKKFGDEQRTGRIATAFAILAIFISCLGLFAMATFIAEQRIKEIGVRKVLGATVIQLWRLLSAEFIGLVTISLLIATPLAWYFMNSWLQNYPYHSTLPWWIFGAACGGAILITLSTISYQSIKAALTNPIESLRTE